MQIDKSRQRGFIAVNANLTRAKTTLAAANANFVQRRISGSNGDQSNPSLPAQQKSFFAAVIIRGLNLLEHKTLDIKGEATMDYFQRKKHSENHYLLRILTKIEGSRPRIQALSRFSALVVIFLQFQVWFCDFSAFFGL